MRRALDAGEGNSGVEHGHELDGPRDTGLHGDDRRRLVRRRRARARALDRGRLRGRLVARADDEREAQPEGAGVVSRQLLELDVHRHLLSGGDAGDREREEVRAMLLEQRGALAFGLCRFVLLLRPLAFAHLADDALAAGDELERVDRRVLGQREEVDRLDRHRVGIDEALIDAGAGDRADDREPDRGRELRSGPVGFGAPQRTEEEARARALAGVGPAAVAGRLRPAGGRQQEQPGKENPELPRRDRPPRVRHGPRPLSDCSDLDRRRQ